MCGHIYYIVSQELLPGTQLFLSSDRVFPASQTLTWHFDRSADAVNPTLHSHDPFTQEASSIRSHALLLIPSQLSPSLASTI